MKIRVQMVSGGVSAYQNDFDKEAAAISCAETLSKGCDKVQIVTKAGDIIHYQTTKGYIRAFALSEEPSEVLFHMSDLPESSMEDQNDEWTEVSHKGNRWSFGPDELAQWEEEDEEFHFQSYHQPAEPSVDTVKAYIDKLPRG